MRILQLDPAADEPDHAVRRIQFRPDGQVFAALVGPERAVADVLWWNLAADRIVERSSSVGDSDETVGAADFREEYPAPALSPDLELVAWTSATDPERGESVRVLDTWAKPSEEVFAWSTQGLPVMYECLSFHPSGETLYSIGLSGFEGGPLMVYRWDVEALFDPDPFGESDAEIEPIELPESSSNAAPTGIALSPDGRRLAVGLDLGVALVYSLTAPRDHPVRFAVEDESDRHVRELLFSPGGKRLWFRCDSTLGYWSLDDGECRPCRVDAQPTGFAFSPDGRTLAVSRLDGTVAFLDADTFAERQRFRWDVGPLHCVAFAPDGLTCLAGADLARVVMWDVDA